MPMRIHNPCSHRFQCQKSTAQLAVEAPCHSYNQRNSALHVLSALSYFAFLAPCQRIYSTAVFNSIYCSCEQLCAQSIVPTASISRPPHCSFSPPQYKDCAWLRRGNNFRIAYPCTCLCTALSMCLCTALSMCLCSPMTAALRRC